MRAALLLAALAACGYPPLDEGGGGNPDGGGSDKCSAPATYGTASFASQDAFYYPPTAQDPEALSYLGKLTGMDYLDIELFETPGTQFGNGVRAPVTVNLTGGETQLSTCSACVLVDVKCTVCMLGSDYQGEPYMATGGTLNITAINPNITGTLTNATFVHVSIDNNGNSAPVSDGCTTKVASASFTAHVRQ